MQYLVLVSLRHGEKAMFTICLSKSWRHINVQYKSPWVIETKQCLLMVSMSHKDKVTFTVILHKSWRQSNMLFSYPRVMKTKQHFLLVSMIHGHKAVMTVCHHESLFFYSKFTLFCKSLNFDWPKSMYNLLINQTPTQTQLSE